MKYFYFLQLRDLAHLNCVQKIFGAIKLVKIQCAGSPYSVYKTKVFSTMYIFPVTFEKPKKKLKMADFLQLWVQVSRLTDFFPDMRFAALNSKFSLVSHTGCVLPVPPRFISYSKNIINTSTSYGTR